MAISIYLNKWNQVPSAVKKFILRATIILLAWKIIYLIFLLPTRILDKPLSHATSSGSVWLLSTFSGVQGFSAKSETGRVDTDFGIKPMSADNVYYYDRNVISIEDGCNALELIILYAGFIICMPAGLRRKIIFIITGILTIYVVNIIRCAGIAYIILYYPKYTDFAHHYVFTFVVYGVIIAMWLIFSKKLKLTHANAD